MPGVDLGNDWWLPDKCSASHLRLWSSFGQRNNDFRASASTMIRAMLNLCSHTCFRTREQDEDIIHRIYSLSNPWKVSWFCIKPTIILHGIPLGRFYTLHLTFQL